MCCLVPVSKVDSVTPASKQRHETLNKLLAQTDDTSVAVDDQKQRIKIAFAEGYLAANTEDKLGIAAKFLKVITAMSDDLYSHTTNNDFNNFVFFFSSFHKSYRWHCSLLWCTFCFQRKALYSGEFFKFISKKNSNI